MVKRGLGSPKVSRETIQRVTSLGGQASKGGGRRRKPIDTE